MLATGSPRLLWDDYLELKAIIHLNHLNSAYLLGGKDPEMYMSGETADISQFCELAEYDWIMYHPGAIDYPDALICLGKYLGPAIDVNTMTAKILQHNDKVVYRSTYWTLTIEEMVDPQV